VHFVGVRTVLRIYVCLGSERNYKTDKNRLIFWVPQLEMGPHTTDETRRRFVHNQFVLGGHMHIRCHELAKGDY
jgi:hypothetical protein